MRLSELKPMQKRKRHPFIAAGILVAIVAVIAFIFAVHTFGWDWTGFTAGASKITITRTPTGTTTATELQPARTLWDWLGLLAALAIPVVVGLGAAWFTAQQGKVSDAENTNNQREAALQAYIDKISELLLHEHLGESPGNPQIEDELRGIDLHGANLSRVDLSGINLSATDLSGTDLSYAKLRKAFLIKANLSEGYLIGTDFTGADLTEANRRGAFLYVADLSDADLSRADLRGATITQEQLEKAKSLKGVTMPNGKNIPNVSSV